MQAEPDCCGPAVLGIAASHPVLCSFSLSQLTKVLSCVVCCMLQLLLELYSPLIYNRVSKAVRRQSGADYGELLSAARQGLLQAAAKFDPARATGSSARLAALADMYIRNALRSVLQEVCGSGGLNHSREYAIWHSPSAQG